MNMTKDCKTIRPLISELTDGALDNDTAWRVRMHLSVCPDCARVSADLEKTASLVKGLAPKELSANFDAALAARIAALPQANAQQARRAGWLSGLGRMDPIRLRLGIAAAAAIILLGAVFARVTVHPSMPATGHIAAVSDNALLASCLRQHHAYVASDPLADSSAQTLASQVDAPLGANQTSSVPESL